MKIVTIHDAKTHLSRFIQDVLAGEEIVIAKGNKPLVKIVPLESALNKRQLGCASGLIQYISDDFDEPLDDFKDYAP